MRSLLLSFLLLLPALVQAAPPPTPRRLSVIMVPMDKAAEASVLKDETYANEVLKEYEGIQLKTSDDLFPVADDVESAASLKRAELGFSESQTAFKARNFDDAERKLRAELAREPTATEIARDLDLMVGEEFRHGPGGQPKRVSSDLGGKFTRPRIGGRWCKERRAEGEDQQPSPDHAINRPAPAWP